SRGRQDREGAWNVGVREIQVEQYGRDQEYDERAQEAVTDGEEADPGQVRDTPHRRHERVLDRALPSLPRDGVGRLHEDQREIAPKQRADEQVQLRLAQVERAVFGAERTEAGGEVADR